MGSSRRKDKKVRRQAQRSDGSDRSFSSSASPSARASHRDRRGDHRPPPSPGAASSQRSRSAGRSTARGEAPSGPMSREDADMLDLCPTFPNDEQAVVESAQTHRPGALPELAAGPWAPGTPVVGLPTPPLEPGGASSWPPGADPWAAHLRSSPGRSGAPPPPAPGDASAAGVASGKAVASASAIPGMSEMLERFKTDIIAEMSRASAESIANMVRTELPRTISNVVQPLVAQLDSAMQARFRAQELRMVEVEKRLGAA
eukprot:9491860-Pyramimonas_sp.AAC.1